VAQRAAGSSTWPRDNEGPYAFVIDRLTQRAEVTDVRTSVVYEHIRSPSIRPAAPSALTQARCPAGSAIPCRPCQAAD
jgi:hypothetical protein